MGAACLCLGLQRAFGAEAPRCGVCLRAEATAALVAEGFTTVPRAWLVPYQDCGVEVRTSGTREEQAVWVPEWAANVVEAMNPHSGFCGPVLRRAVENASFLAAVESILRLTKKDGRGQWNARHTTWLNDVCTRLEALAVAEGLQPLPPVTS